MLQRLMSIFKAAPEQTQLERVATFDLEGRPLTRALLLRAAEYQDEAIRFARQLGNKQAITQGGSLTEFATGCAASVATMVTQDALKVLGRPAAFFPYEPLPKYAPMAVAFSLFALASIYSHLKAEGVDLDFTKVASQTAGLFFVSHPDKERIEYAQRGCAAFQAVAKSDARNVQEWQDALSKLVPMYLLQWTTSNDEYKQADFLKAFASQLASLLKAIE